MQQCTAPCAEDKDTSDGHFAVATYMRVSTAEQRGRYGIPSQAEAIRSFLRRRPTWRITGQHQDLAESGATDSRPGFDALLEDTSEGRANLVLVHRLDRLGRTEAAIWRCMWQIEDAGASVESCVEPLGAAGIERWLSVDRLARAVEADYRRIAACTQAGRQLKAIEGGWPGGPAPYGFRISGSGAFGSTLEIDAAEAAVVVLVADLVISGLPLAGVVEELNERGITTRSGKRWTAANLHRRVKGAAFHGQAVFRRDDQQWGDHCTRLDEDGRPVHGDKVVIPLPPILPANRIRAFQRALAEMSRPRKKQKGKYPLTGRIFGRCGRPYVGCLRSKDGVRTYRCSGWNTAVVCDCVSLPADPVEERAALHVNALLASIPTHSRPMPPGLSQPPTHLVRHRERVTSLERLVAQGARDLEGLRGSQPSRVVVAAMRQLGEEQEALERILLHARAWLAELEGRVDGHVRWVAVMGADTPDVRALSATELRDVMESLDLRVTLVDPDFRYREGTKCLTTQWHEHTGTLVPPDPTDSQWGRIEALLRSRYRPHHFRSSIDLRAAFMGMLHRLRTGILWCDLPAGFGMSAKVRWRQRTWLADGVWSEMVKLLNDEGTGTPVRSHGALPGVAIRTRFGVTPSPTDRTRETVNPLRSS